MPWVIAAIEAVHAATLFPGVGGRINAGDSAKFQFIGHVLGLSHPPGNPLYVLLNAAWVRLPSPLRTCTQVSLLSMLFGAVTLVYVFRALSKLANTTAAIVGTIALGLGPLFWTLATEAEVYTLNTALLAAALFYAISFALDDAGKERAFLLAAFFYLLGFANHLTSVALLPAFGWLWLRQARAGTRIAPRSVLLVALFALLSASVYAYVPWRVHAAAAYSEFVGKPEPRDLWKYVTAKHFQSHFRDFSVERLVLERMPAFARFLQKQWLWPLLLVVPIGLGRLRARSSMLFEFLLLSLCGLLLFAVFYEIKDADGFYMPIVVLLAVVIGFAFAELPLRGGKALAIWTALVLCLAPPAIVHVQQYQKQLGIEVVQSIGQRERVLWDLDDVFARIPEGARFVVPCGHYGCVQVLNYYRFADPVMAHRNISFVRFRGMRTGMWGKSAPPGISSKRGSEVVICSLRERDADAMRRRGVAVRTIEREGRSLAGVAWEGVPIYCSLPKL